MTRRARDALHLGGHATAVRQMPDGSIILRSTEELRPHNVRYTERLEHWATNAGDRVFLAQRLESGSGWRTITYREAFASVERLSQALVDRGLGTARPLMIMSGNTIEHALMGLAALHVGIPYSAVSTGYALLSTDFVKLRHCYDLLTPGLVFVEDMAKYGRALAAVVPPGMEVVCGKTASGERAATEFESLLRTTAGPAVQEATSRVCSETVARILFTSGSTALPKGVVTTHGMCRANMQMVEQAWPFTTESPVVMCDWLPWNHTFGGSLIMGLIIQSGGTLHIDDGRPTPALIAKTVSNLTDVRPTIFIGVPASFEALLPFIEKDAEFRQSFFSRMDMLYYSAASLPDAVSERYRNLAREVSGGDIYIGSGYGSTETGPLLVVCNWMTRLKGVVGLPVAGSQVKLLPNGAKLEIRGKGPAVFRGYFRQPELTAKAFDEEGWYRLGDAVRFADPADMLQGMKYDGRVVEDFKLKTGTWINVAALREVAINGLLPLASHVLICGADESEIGLIVIPALDACGRLQAAAGEESCELLESFALREEFQRRLDRMADMGNSSSTRITRMLVSRMTPSDAEVTDKNTLSTNVALARRVEEVARLFAPQASGDVFVAAKRPDPIP